LIIRNTSGDTGPVDAMPAPGSSAVRREPGGRLADRWL